MGVALAVSFCWWHPHLDFWPPRPSVRCLHASTSLCRHRPTTRRGPRVVFLIIVLQNSPEGWPGAGVCLGAVGSLGELAAHTHMGSASEVGQACARVA